MKRKSTLWPKKRVKPRPGPVPPPEGRVRIYVNLPKSLKPFVDSLPGRSASAKIVNALATMKDQE